MLVLLKKLLQDQMILNLIINDLLFDIDIVKYVDEITMSSISTDPNDSSLQSATDHSCSWSVKNSICIKEKRTKALLIHFGTKTDMNSVPTNGKIIERVNNFKLLGVISSDLSWHAHVRHMLGKVSKSIFCINNLARAGIHESDIIQVFISTIRSVFEYVCPVWHPGLSKTQSNEIGRVQERCLGIIYPKLTYTEALLISRLDSLHTRREIITCD